MFKNKVKTRNVLVIELAAWACLVFSFLAMYTLRYRAPLDAILPHLSIVASTLFGLIALRGLCWRVLGAGGLSTALISILMLAPWLVLATWYLLILIGLDSWGRVTTWPLIRTYASQVQHLSHVLGAPFWLLVSSTVAVLSLALIFVYSRLARQDWILQPARHGSILATAGLAGFLAAGLIQAFKFVQTPPVEANEPLAMSIFPDLRARRAQSHNLAHSWLLDAAEEESRQAYRPSTKESDYPNIILIIGDALRADHMGVYGYSRNTTPHLHKLIDSTESVVVRNVRAVCAESACGLMAMAASRPIHRMPGTPITLHEILRLHGYRVHMILGGDHTNFYGLKDSYGAVDSYFDGSNQRKLYINDDALVTDRLDKLPAHDGLHPAFFQFHLMSTHGLGSRNSIWARYTPHLNYYGVLKFRESLTGLESSRAVNYYDNGVVQFDAITNSIIKSLRNKGYLDRAIIVITADHGESLGEHGEFGHASGVSEPMLRIPLIFATYNADISTNITEDDFVSQIDIAPTILHYIGVPPPDAWEGAALQAATPFESRILNFQQSGKIGLYDIGGRGNVMKYWRELSNGDEYAFDVLRDPFEEYNIAPSVNQATMRHWRNMVSGASFVSDGG